MSCWRDLSSPSADQNRTIGFHCWTAERQKVTEKQRNRNINGGKKRGKGEDMASDFMNYREQGKVDLLEHHKIDDNTMSIILIEALAVWTERDELLGDQLRLKRRSCR